MKRTYIVICLLTILIISPAAMAQNWKAGTSRVNILPEKQIWMSGYGGRDHVAEGKLTDLWAKSLAITDANGNTGVLITLDLVGIHADTTAAICEALKEQHGLERSQIAINCSHTHTGPAVGMNLGPLHYLQIPKAEQEQLDLYEKALIKKVVSGVSQAIEDVEPASLNWGSGLCAVAVNRRNNSESQVPEVRIAGKLNGPYDHDVPVLAVRRADKSLKTIVFGYACHATVLSFYQWSGDYPGFAQISVEEQFPGVNAMFWAGCGADQNPLPRRTVELAKSYGHRLGTAVGEVINGTMHAVESTLRTEYTEVDLPLQQLPTVDELKGRLDSDQKYEKARAKYILDRLGDKKELDTTYPYPIGSWRIGKDVRFVFLGGEVVVDYAISIKSLAAGTPEDRAQMVWVAGYSNDVMAYIPSRRVLREGGYEGGGSNAYYGMPGLWAPELEAMIMHEVEEQWK